MEVFSSAGEKNVAGVLTGVYAKDILIFPELNLFMKVLVATWGNPNAEWKEVTYHLKDKQFRNKTTYLPLFKVENPDKGIIIVQNSLFPVFGISDENSLKKEIVEKLRKFGADGETLEKTEVIVTISAGKYNGIKFDAGFYDILLNLFIQLYFCLKDADEVVLDLTHGINYLPNITILAISHLKKIMGFRLRLYNATPVTRDVEESWILELGEVNLESKLKINIEDLERIQNEIKRVFREKLDFNVRHAFKLLVAYLYGLIFPLVKNSSEFDFKEKFLFELIPRQKKENNTYYTKRYERSEDLFKYIFTLLFAENIAKEFRGKKITLDIIKEIKEKIPNPVAKKLIENEYKMLETFYTTCQDIFLEKEKISYREALKILSGESEKGEDEERVGHGEFETAQGKKPKNLRNNEINEIRNYFAHVSLLWHKTFLYRDRIEFESENSKKDMNKPIEKIKEIEL